MGVNIVKISTRLANKLADYFYRVENLNYEQFNLWDLDIDLLLSVDLNKFKSQKMVGKKTFFEMKELVERYQEKSIIKQLELSDEDVLKVVKEWYTNGMCAEIFQNEEGEDLEEYLEQIITN